MGVLEAIRDIIASNGGVPKSRQTPMFIETAYINDQNGQTYPVTTVEMDFDSRDAVKIWMADNQFGRRDLTVYERSLLAIKIKPSIAAIAKEKSLANLKQNAEVKNSCPRAEEPAPAPKPKSARENKTDYQVAQKAGRAVISIET